MQAQVVDELNRTYDIECTIAWNPRIRNKRSHYCSMSGKLSRPVDPMAAPPLALGLDARDV